MVRHLPAAKAVGTRHSRWFSLEGFDSWVTGTGHNGGGASQSAEFLTAANIFGETFLLRLPGEKSVIFFFIIYYFYLVK